MDPTSPSGGAPALAWGLARPAVLQAVFTAAIGGSALLMFGLEPMVGKALLPALGGTPQVWNTCMVFFQATLFAGYLHAHHTSRWLGERGQAIAHVLLAFAALLFLPYGLDATRLAAPDAEHPVAWLATVLVGSIGLPVFVIAATAPLLQKWFARSAHPAARDPYFLYVASNAGSLVALLAYPTLVERHSGLSRQWLGWSVGFALLVVAVAACAALVRHGPARPVAPAVAATVDTPAPGWALRWRWLMLSFVPSSLLLGVTTFITTDVAAVPLFWVVPLALYLVTFILAFARRPWPGPAGTLRAQAFVLVLLAVLALLPGLLHSVVALSAGVHLAAFFLCALVCHGELARSRPDARHLTDFYLWLSLGGLLGGMFNALLAPVLFTQLVEYPLGIVLACLLRPAAAGASTRSQRLLDAGVPALLLAAAVLGPRGLGWLSTVASAPVAVGVAIVAAVLAAVLLLGSSERPLRFALAVGAVFTAGALSQGGEFARLGSTVFQARSFFGVVRVIDAEAMRLKIFVHGSTVHGVQSTDPARASTPLAYYHPGGAFAQLLQGTAATVGDRPVAIVGLGAGGLACYGRPGSEWTFYEIDPMVERVARDPRFFGLLRDCPVRPQVVLGDARLTLRQAPDGRYGLIVIDAFTSDAIPTHLLTREALALYRRKLAPGGAIAVHISNRHLNLAPTVGNLARDAGLAGRISRPGPVPDLRSILMASPALLVVLGADEAALGALASHPGWQPLPTDPAARVWSDDHVDIVRVLFGR